MFDVLCWRDAQRVADIIIEHCARFWRFSYDNPEFNVLMRNRAACATARLDGVDWVDPDGVNRAISRAADALQPNITVGSSSWVTCGNTTAPASIWPASIWDVIPGGRPF